MKQIVLCLIGILLASFVSAQKINHPSLLYTPQRIQQVKGKTASMATYKNFFIITFYIKLISSKVNLKMQSGHHGHPCSCS